MIEFWLKTLRDVDCDMVTDYDTYLEFDDERTPRDFDDRGEDPDDYIVYEDASTATGSGCVIEMYARSARGLVEKNVRRSAVWLSVDAFANIQFMLSLEWTQQVDMVD